MVSETATHILPAVISAGPQGYDIMVAIGMIENGGMATYPGINSVTPQGVSIELVLPPQRLFTSNLTLNTTPEIDNPCRPHSTVVIVICNTI